MIEHTKAEQFARCEKLKRDARALGFTVEMSTSALTPDYMRFKPTKGLPKLLLGSNGVDNHKFFSVESAIAWLAGWDVLERHLSSQAGLELEEIADRVEQQRVLRALQGGPKSPKSSRRVLA